MALDALVLLVGRTGQRSVPLADFYRLPTRENRGDTVLAVDELIAEVLIPGPAANSRGTYVKVAERGSWDFALASAAVQLTFAGGTVAQARVVLGGVAPAPWRALEAENELVGKALSPDAIEQAALAATAGARPLEQNGYKVHLAQGAVRQALRSLR
jgi:xanthine dehydrogenase YagS FAD-binding subunit